MPMDTGKFSKKLFYFTGKFRKLKPFVVLPVIKHIFRTEVRHVAKKVKSFADKMIAKADVVYCDTCGKPAKAVVLVEPERNPATGHYRYIRKKVKLCADCNEKEIYA